MPTQIQNIVTASGGVAQELVPARFGRSRLIVEPQDAECWVQCGSVNAAVNVGERIAQGSSAQFTVQGFPDIGGRWTFFSATTGDDIVVRET